jgi:hypothetical protein
MEYIAAQGQPQHLQFADNGYYNMANNQPPLHEYHDPTINNYAGVAMDVPVQAQATPPALVSTELTFSHTHF